MTKSIRNLIVFKRGWVGCVMFAAAREPHFATLAVSAVVAAHLAAVRLVFAERVLPVCAAVIGPAWKSLLIHSGLVSCSGYPSGASLAPH